MFEAPHVRWEVARDEGEGWRFVWGAVQVRLWRPRNGTPWSAQAAHDGAGGQWTGTGYKSAQGALEEALSGLLHTKEVWARAFARLDVRRAMRDQSYKDHYPCVRSGVWERKKEQEKGR